MYLIKHCAECDREIHIHKHRITGHPEPCEHITKKGKFQSVTVKARNGKKPYEVKVKVI